MVHMTKTADVFHRRRYALVLEKAEGGFEFNSGMGWAPCSTEQAAHIRVADRVAPLFVRDDQKRRRGREVSAGLRAFGTPFWVRK